MRVVMLLLLNLYIKILFAENTNIQRLYLPKFYSQNPYTYLNPYYSNEKVIQKNKECNAKIKPFFGIRTKKEYIESPTKAAVDGLTAVINEDISFAKSCADYLLANSKTYNNALLFPFRFDFVPYMPYDLKSGWVSGLSQGLSLGLFSHLYLKTKEIQYLKIAEKIFNSYKLPIKEGGFTRFYSDSVFFEQYPTKEFIGVFNGSAVAALALWDYYIITNNKDAYLLFDRYIKWLENNIYKYEKIDNRYNIPVSYYSLAIRRPELLFKFYGDGVMLINKIDAAGIKDGKKKLLYSLKLGSKKDDNPKNNIYLFADKEHCNWSPPQNEGRYINKNKGIYNHSPFYVAYNSEYEEYEISIRLKKISNNPVQLQIYDGKEYINLGKIMAPTNQLTTIGFFIDKELIKRSKKSIKNEPIVEPKYLDDNFILLSLLAEISKSPTLIKYSSRWETSTDLVDSEWFNKFPPKVLSGPIKIIDIDISDRCRFGIEGINLIKYNNLYYLFYNCKIEVSENRISLASGEDIYNLKEMGWIFKNEFIRDNNINSALNPYIVENKNLFTLFFKANDMLYATISDDIWKWETIKEIYPYKVGKFSILLDKNKFELYSVDSTNKNKINFTDLNTFEKRTIIEEPFYKHFSDLNVFMSNKHKLLLARAELPERVDSYLYIECKEDSFVNSTIKPFIIEGSHTKTPHTKRRDYFIFSENDKIYLLFTGYNPNQEISNGIYITQIKDTSLKDIIEKSCHLVPQNQYNKF